MKRGKPRTIPKLFPNLIFIGLLCRDGFCIQSVQLNICLGAFSSNQPDFSLLSFIIRHVAMERHRSQSVTAATVPAVQYHSYFTNPASEKLVPLIPKRNPLKASTSAILFSNSVVPAIIFLRVILSDQIKTPGAHLSLDLRTLRRNNIY